MTASLTIDVLKSAVAGQAAAFRRIVELQPVGGPGSKVFPPTYEGGKYATEKRRINGEVVDCVLLDSVQSQANRMELALQDAWEEGLISLPVITVDFTNTAVPWVGKITSLQAPHRIADAILRDSELDGKPFRQSSVGKLLDEVSAQKATALFQYCPTALVFGMWDSTGARGGLGVKFARTVVSEIIGIAAVPGQRTSSRIDPLQIGIKAGPVFEAPDGNWILDSQAAVRDEKGNPVKYGKKGRPSEINHGNVTPSFVVRKDRERVLLDDNGNPIPIGGFTIDRAQQMTVISLPALRRLKFPVKDKPEANQVGHVVLTALALCAATLASEQGYDLRSQCALIATNSLMWELIDRPGQQPQTFALNGAQAIDLLKSAQSDAAEWGLQMQTNITPLTPRTDLVELIKRSYTESVDTAEEGGNT